MEDKENEELFEETEDREEPVEAAEKPDYEAEIIGIIKSDTSPRAMQSKLESYHESDIANILEKLTLAERQKFFRILDVEILSEILAYTDEETAAVYVGEMNLKKAATVIAEMDSDTAVDILRAIEKEKRKTLIDLLDEDSREDIRLIASFDEDEIGSKMTTNYISIKQGISVKEAMHELVDQAAENDNISTLFVVDDGGEFYGAIDLKELIIARRDTKLDDLIVTSFPYVYGHEDVADCIERLKNYSEDSIPVLDNRSRLLGVITAHSLVEVVDEEMGEDYAKFAGLTAEEDLSETPFQSVKKRLPWLLVLLGLGMGISAVVGVFEAVVSQLTIIMAFQSLILDMAGNVGTQSLAVTIRVLTDETLTGKQKVGLVFKEMRVGLINGFILGILSFLIIGLYIALVKGKGFLFGYAVSGCIGVSLIVAMLISSAIGTLIPLFFKKIKVDPAVASGPLITTVNDLVAVVTYYGMSWILLLNVIGLVN